MRRICGFFSLWLIFLCFFLLDLSQAQLAKTIPLKDQQWHQEQQLQEDEQEDQQKQQQQTANLHSLEQHQQAELSGASVPDSNLIGSQVVSNTRHRGPGHHNRNKED